MALLKESWIEYKKRGTIKSHWSAKWLELFRVNHQSSLRLYNDRSKKPLEKEIFLPETGVTVEALDELHGKRFEFGFTVAFGSKLYSFAADKRELRGEWVAAIENAAQHDPNMNFSAYNRHSSKAAYYAGSDEEIVDDIPAGTLTQPLKAAAPMSPFAEEKEPNPPPPPGPPPPQSRAFSSSPRSSRQGYHFESPSQDDFVPPPPPPAPTKSGSPTAREMTRVQSTPAVSHIKRRSLDDSDMPMAYTSQKYSQSARTIPNPGRSTRDVDSSRSLVPTARVKRVKFKKKFHPSKPSSILLWGRSHVDNLFPENAEIAAPFQHEGLSRRQFVSVVGAKAGRHFFGITLEGWVITWGAVEMSDAATRGNPLGIGGSVFIAQPTMLRALTKREITHIACSSLHALALTNRDEVFGWGDRSLTSLPSATHEPTLIDHLTGHNTVGVACADTHSLVWSNTPKFKGSSVRASVTAFGFGGCWLGLGPGNDAVNLGEVQFDSQVQPDNEITLCECGPRYSFVMFNDGRVCTFGVNTNGRMGVIKATGEPYKKTSEPLWLNLPPCFHMSAAHEHAAFVATNGQLFTTGNGGYNRLGHGDNSPRWDPRPVEALRDTKIVDVLCVQARTYVLTDQGCVLMWGLEDTQEHIHQIPVCVEVARAWRCYKLAGCMDATACLSAPSRRERVPRPPSMRFTITKNKRSLFYQSTKLPSSSPRQTPTSLSATAQGLGGFSLLDRHLAQNFAPASIQPQPQPHQMTQVMYQQPPTHTQVVYQQPSVQYVVDASGRPVQVVQQYQYPPTQMYHQVTHPVTTVQHHHPASSFHVLPAPGGIPGGHPAAAHSHHHAHAQSMQLPAQFQHTPATAAQVYLQQTQMPPSHDGAFAAQVSPSPGPPSASSHPPGPPGGDQQYYFPPPAHGDPHMHHRAISQPTGAHPMVVPQTSSDRSIGSTGEGRESRLKISRKP